MIAFSFVNEADTGNKRHPIPQAYEDITVVIAESAVFTAALKNKCVAALVKWEGGPFRVRMDGGNPVGLGTVSGYLRQDGDEYFCSRAEAQKLVTVIDQVAGGTTGFMRVTYYG